MLPRGSALRASSAYLLRNLSPLRIAHRAALRASRMCREKKKHAVHQIEQVKNEKNL